MNQKTILFCGNGMSGESLRPIKQAGYKICVITEFPNDNGLEVADAVETAISKDVDQALAAAAKLYAKGYHFDGVLSLCWDCAISVSAIAKKFGLRGISVEAAKNATIKSLRSDAFAKNSIPAPRYRVAKGMDNVRNAALEIGFPVVIKPLDLSSSKGVILSEGLEDFEKCYNYTLKFTENGEMIINEYLKGTEHGAEALMINGILHPIGISDRIFKYDELKPFFVEVGDIMPSSLQPKVQDKIWKVIERAAHSLGIFEGIVHGDMMVIEDTKPYVLEIAARLGGPRFGTEMIPLSNGTNILLAAVQQAVGDPIDMVHLEEKFSRGMVNRSLFPKPGKITKITGIEKIKSMKGYYDFKWWTLRPFKTGDIIESAENTCGFFAYFVCTGDTREEAIQNADYIERQILVETDPLSKEWFSPKII